MKFFRNISLICLFILLNSCSTINDGFSNKKNNNSDEFLVEKKSPLVMPPDYGELPLPEKSRVTDISNQNKIKELLTNNSNESLKSEDTSENFEEFLLKKIKKD